MTDRIYWISVEGKPSAKLEVKNVAMLGSPIQPEGHIRVVGDTVIFTNASVFPGHLTHWGGVKWGVLGLLRLGELRVNRIKRFLTLGRFKG